MQKRLFATIVLVLAAADTSQAFMEFLDYGLLNGLDKRAELHASKGKEQRVEPTFDV
jgi:hypothetical protein